MKKKKIIKLLIITFLCFCFGFCKIKALPLCNIGTDPNNKKGYGYAWVKVDSSIRTGVGDSGQVWICKNADCHGTTTLTNGWTTWSDNARDFYVEYDAGPGNKITEISYILYGDYEGCDGCKLCVGKPAVDISNNTGVANINFSIEQGHVYKISATGKYVDSKGKTKDFATDSFTIRKKLGDTKSVKNTESSNIDSTTLPKAEIGSNAGASGIIYSSTTTTGLNIKAGTKKGKVKQDVVKTSVDAEGNTIIVSNGTSCTDVKALIHDYWKYVMIIVPVLLIVMMVLDFFKALSSNDSDAINKATSNAFKRTIAAVILLALPALLGLILGWFGIPLCI